jgi:hypothetical protein
MNMRRAGLVVVVSATAAGLLLGACSGPADTPAAAGSTGPEKDDTYCSLTDLAPSMRHTYLLLDERALVHAASVEEFVSKNAHVRDAILTFADPKRNMSAEFSDYRERLSVFVVPANGNAPQRIFTGCMPTLSSAEMAKAQKGDSAVSQFFRGDLSREMEDEQAAFRGHLNGALLRAATTAPEKPTFEVGAFLDSVLLRSLSAAGRLINSDSGLPRVVLLSNLARIDTGGANTAGDARRAGFADGAKASVDLGRSELHVFLVDGGKSELAREYLSSFFLTRNARLLSWANMPSDMPPAPKTVARYLGTSEYVTADVSVELRLAADQDGRLQNSWLVLQADPAQSIPLTGTYRCDDAGHCQARVDHGNFAQAWSANTGAVTDFDPHLPFAGARNWEFDITGDHLTGRVFDPVAKYKTKTGDLQLKANLAPDATF